MADNDQERTEQPTSRKRELSRQEGNFATSRELSSFFVLLGGLVVLYFAGLWVAAGIADLMRSSFSLKAGELTVREISGLFHEISWKLLVIVLPFFAIPLFGAVSYIAQNGLVFTGKSLEPKLEKINPLKGLKKILSVNSLIELVKSILKISILSYVVFNAVEKEWGNLPFLVDMDPGASFVYIGRVSFSIMVKTAWVLAVIAVLDYAAQKWQFEKGLRMTKEEIREEMKELEGDPVVKARIKSIQRDLARKRMMQDVPRADVVVTNPTHIAVALRYDRSKANAPVVVAKGAGLVAARIREIAKEHRVPVIENKPLARTLFKAVEVGMEIPATLYRAVAELLAYVYRLKSRPRA